MSCRIDDGHFSHFMLDVPNATLNFFANWKKIKFRCQSNSASWSLRDLRGQHEWHSKEGHGRRQKFFQGPISYKSNAIFGILNFNLLAVLTVFFGILNTLFKRRHLAFMESIPGGKFFCCFLEGEDKYPNKNPKTRKGNSNPGKTSRHNCVMPGEGQVPPLTSLSMLMGRKVKHV